MQMKQQILINWVENNLEPGNRVYNTYCVKQLVERNIGEYIDNDEMREAMLETGYEPIKGTLNYINWSFCLKDISLTNIKR